MVVAYRCSLSGLWSLRESAWVASLSPIRPSDSSIENHPKSMGGSFRRQRSTSGSRRRAARQCSADGEVNEETTFHGLSVSFISPFTPSFLWKGTKISSFHGVTFQFFSPLLHPSLSTFWLNICNGFRRFFPVSFGFSRNFPFARDFWSFRDLRKILVLALLIFRALKEKIWPIWKNFGF